MSEEMEKRRRKNLGIDIAVLQALLDGLEKLPDDEPAPDYLDRPGLTVAQVREQLAEQIRTS